MLEMVYVMIQEELTIANSELIVKIVDLSGLITSHVLMMMDGGTTMMITGPLTTETF
jgi:hypothetical protein